ncbi:Na/Pi cotransporter family protein [Pusillimonas minor]|uniref:Na/Pi symporter n=1 Tax=Pusillimonas minor TaxID=2697024 RepID=A0A842HKK8_9BURK|nr:Na/Pi symporter [Pusillimonas minor]MBC2768302.1 Na/Pi symporter [Pusillimonas minor]
MSDILFPFIGGIGLFLIGMMLLSEGLVSFAGPALRSALIRFTGTPFKAFLSGTLTTALVQSSSATTVTIIGFVSAGLITFTQAVGFVIGTSLGNTATGWIVAVIGLKIKFGFYTLPLIGIGALLKLLGRGRIRDLGVALAGFGMLFLGLTTLQDSMRELSSLVDFASLPVGGFWAHIVVMLFGLVLTIILQSSSAAIATTLTALYTQTINFEQAGALVIGASIGTTVTGILVTIGATVAAKRTAVANIVFNLVAGVIAIILFPGLLAATKFLSQNVEIEPGTIGLVLFHTLFIGLGVVLFMPFTTQFARFVERLLPEKEEDIAGNLDNSTLGVPEVALEASQRALEKIATLLFSTYEDACKQPGTAIDATLLDRTRIALDRAYDFISRVPLESDQNKLAEQRIAQLHAADHLIRFRQRLFELTTQPIDFAGPDYQWALEHNLRMLELARASTQRDATQDTIEEIGREAGTLEGLSRQLRHDILQGGGRRHAAAAQLLHTTDAIRWLERSGHHIWRICHYLTESRVNGHPVAEPVIEETPPAVTETQAAAQADAGIEHAPGEQPATSPATESAASIQPTAPETSDAPPTTETQQR